MARSRERRSRGRRSRRTDHPSRTGGENRSARTSEQEGHRMSRRDGTHGNVIGGRTHSDSGRNGKPETLSAADLMALDPLPATPIVQGILYVGVTLFAGKPKIGKSWMMLALALAVTTGSTIFGNTTVQQGEILYLALEDNRRRLQRRIKKLLSDREAPAGLHFALDWPRLDEGGLEALDKLLEEQPGINLVIVDTLARLKPAGSKKRTHYDEDRDSVDSLIPLADKHSIAIVLVHHLREMDSDDPLDMIHGTAGLTGGVDGALVLKRRRGEADAYLFGDGRDFENTVLLVLRDWLASFEVGLVGMEATGVYWKPIYYILEDDFELWLLNARHLKGRSPAGRPTYRTLSGSASLLSTGLCVRALCRQKRSGSLGTSPATARLKNRGAHKGGPTS